MDDHRGADPVGDLPAPPSPPRARRRRVHLPDPGAVPGVPPIPDVLAGSVDPDTPFRRDEPPPARDEGLDLGWYYPPPPPPAVGPLPAPPPPRPVDPSAKPDSSAWHTGGAWHEYVPPDFAPSDEPLAAPRRRRPPWRLLVGALVLAVAVLGGLSALDHDAADTVVDGRPPSFAEQPAVDEQP